MRRAVGPDRALLSAPQRLHPLTDDSRQLELLREGELEIVGRLTDASNATFLCRIRDDFGAAAADAWPEDATDPGLLCVYKPVRGERPLDDFPSGTLARREMAAFVLSEASGWRIVPTTVLRHGPFGEGMVQVWIEPDPDADVLAMVVGADPRLRAVCLFDVIANNADRKGGHVLPLPSGKVLGIDHGICFAVEPKLRTVLWAWRGELLTDEELAVVSAVYEGISGRLGAALRELLSTAEVAATLRRAEMLLAAGRFPLPDPSRPAVPWPPF